MIGETCFPCYWVSACLWFSISLLPFLSVFVCLCVIGAFVVGSESYLPLEFIINRVHPARKYDHAPFVVPHRQYGIAYRMTLEPHHLSLSFEAGSKRTISSLPFNILL